MKIVNIDGENLHSLGMTMNETFRKDRTYDNIKSHEKAEFHHLSRRYILGKTTGGGSKLTPLPSLFRVRRVCFLVKNLKQTYHQQVMVVSQGSIYY